MTEDSESRVAQLLEEKGYRVIKYIGMVSNEKPAIALLNLDERRGQIIVNRLREDVPEIKIISLWSTPLNYGDVNMTSEDAGRLGEIIEGLLQPVGAKEEEGS